MKWAPRDPSTNFFGHQFYSKNARKPRLHVCLHFHARIHIMILPEVDWIHKKLWTLFQFSSVPWGTIIGTKFTISDEFSPFQVKLFYNMISEEYMESELWHFSSKPGLQKYNACVPRDPKPRHFCDISFRKNKQIFWTRLLRPQCVPC